MALNNEVFITVDGSDCVGIKLEEQNTRALSDYEAFPNKVLLDELRSKIIQNLLIINL